MVEESELGCPDASVLAELAEGELGAAEADVVRAHLGDCDSCRTAVARLVVARGRTRGGHVESTPEPEPDDIVADRYRIARRVGRGGMGTVYEAWDPVLERRVALKVIRVRGSGAPERLHERLLRESRALAKLRHPNVVSVYDVGSFEGSPYLAMEFVAGDTLRRWLERTPRSCGEVLAVFEQAGRGLAAAHKVGLVHRDFKPDNVLIRDDGDTDGRAMVLDFGLVRAVAEPRETPGVFADATDAGASTLTESGHLVGTPAYMAPEQFDGGDVDARADVFSFCTALWEGLFGVRPFIGTNVGALRLAIASGVPQRPTPARDIPSRIERAVLSGLAADRAARPELRALLEQLRPRSRRWPWVAAAGLVPLAAVGLSLRLSQHGGEPTDARCGEDPLAHTWNDETRATVDATLSGESDTVRMRKLARVDAHASSLRAGWSSACETRAVDRSRAELELGCLEGRRQGLAALVRVLGEGDIAASEAIDGLPETHDCDADRLLVGLAPLPSDPPQRAEVEAIRAEIEELDVLVEVGRAKDARARMSGLDARAAALDYPPIAANAAYARFTIALALGELETAKAELLSSAQIATASDYDQLGAQAWVDLVYLASEALRDFERGHEYDGNARAAIARLPAGPSRDELEARRCVNAGRLSLREGRPEDARTAYAEALRLSEALAATDDDPQRDEFVADALEGVALVDGATGRLAEAIATYERVLQMRERLLGAEHPGTAMAHSTLGGLENDAGHYEEALAHNRRAREIYEATLGPVSIDVAIALGNEALLLGRVGRHDEAIAAYDRALAAIAATEGPDSYAATRTIQNRAMALVAAGRVREGADALADACRRLETGGDSLDVGDLPKCFVGLADAMRADQRHDEALATARRAVAAAPESAPHLRAETLRALGAALAAKGDHDEAVARLDEGLALLSSGADPLRGATMRMAIARSLVRTRRPDPARARALAVESLRVWEAAPAHAHEAERVRAWLAEHGGAE